MSGTPRIRICRQCGEPMSAAGREPRGNPHVCAVCAGDGDGGDALLVPPTRLLSPVPTGNPKPASGKALDRSREDCGP
jgi:hypothetical protein